MELHLKSASRRISKKGDPDMDKSPDYSKTKSFLLYSYRSLKVNRRSYTVLFLSILCMVLMSSNLIIYNSSVSNAEDQAVKNEYGTYHARFTGMDMKTSESIGLTGSVKRSVEFCYLTTVKNPNPDSDIKEAKLGVLRGSVDDLGFTTLEGEIPSYGEIMISESLSRAFSVYTGDEITFGEVGYVDRIEDLTFKVSGIYGGAKALQNYIITSEDTVDALINVGVTDLENGKRPERQFLLVDKFVVYKSNMRGMIDKYTAETMDLLKIKADDEQSDRNSRAAYQNTEYVSLKKFYQKPAFLITMLMSIIPAAVAMLVFITLDIHKSMKELSVLSMIGTTPKQFFRMLLLKYFYIYLIAFPAGLTLSAVLIKLLCVICDGMNYNENIMLDFHISPLAVAILFVLCLAILGGITLFISKKTTAGTYTEMLSGANDMNNIFVQRTSGSLLKEGKRDLRLASIFFVRNRNVNAMFCAVIAVIMAIITYFTVVLSQEVGNIPVKVDRSDYTVVGDTLRNSGVSTLDDEIIGALQSIDGVERVILSYGEYETYKGKRAGVYIDPSVIVSKPKETLYGNIQKSGHTNAIVIGEEHDQMELLYGQYVVSGDLADLYTVENSVAIFVHQWANNGNYYRAGDQIELKAAYEIDDRTGEVTEYTSYEIYTIAAVLYDRHDEYENVDVMRVLASPEVYSRLMFMDAPYKAGVVLHDNSEEGLAAALSDIRDVCSEYDLKYTNMRDEYLRSRTAMYSSVIFYIILWIALIAIQILMLGSLTGFMLRSRQGYIKTLYMLGSSDKKLFRICGTEILLSGALCAVLGVLLSLAVVIVYILSVRTVMNAYVGWIIAASILFSVLLSLGVPYLTSFMFFKKQKYMS